MYSIVYEYFQDYVSREREKGKWNKIGQGILRVFQKKFLGRAGCSYWQAKQNYLIPNNATEKPKGNVCLIEDDLAILIKWTFLVTNCMKNILYVWNIKVYMKGEVHSHQALVLTYREYRRV